MVKALTTEVYDLILDKLFTGEVRPGQPIDRQKIAVETGSSVGTVLIAMNMLEADGFVETLPRKGTFVRSVGFAEVYGQFLVREAFESEAARIYCGAPITENWERLEEFARKLDQVRRFSADSVHVDATFHTELIKLTGNAYFLEQYSRIMKISIFYTFLQFVPGMSQAARDSHTLLLERLRTEDPDEAEAAIRSHIRSGRPQFFAEG